MKIARPLIRHYIGKLRNNQTFVQKNQFPIKKISGTSDAEPTPLFVQSHDNKFNLSSSSKLGSLQNYKFKNKSVHHIQNIAKQIREELTEEADIDITGVDISSLTWMITQYDITRFDNDEYKTVHDIIPKIISDKNVTQSFSIVDIGSVIRQYRLWRRYLPNVEIFYAIKCNSDPMILRTLASLGVGFDVASNGEINMAIESDVDRGKIIYANPCKRSEHISYARSQNVSLLTFDNENELLKIAHLHPSARLILRIVVDDVTTSKMKFGCKFGCPMYDVEKILNFAKFHKLNIVGVSFHVGSGCIDATSYYNSIKRSREVFDIAKKIGYDFTILDIGGGFPGAINETNAFAEMSEYIQNALKDFFSDIENLRVIAEPGRFFATSALTHVVRITGKKSIRLEKNINKETDKIFHYFIDSSLYGMFNNIIFDKATVKFQLLNSYEGNSYQSVVFGETCDSMDKISEGIDLPELACGDYLFVENHGAYTISSASSFNGFPIHKPIYIFTF
jgi:ornithine decarboxylase